jgi:cysteine synthase
MRSAPISSSWRATPPLITTELFCEFVGAGGTSTGIATFLKERDGSIACYVVEPTGAAVMAGNLSPDRSSDPPSASDDRTVDPTRSSTNGQAIGLLIEAPAIVTPFGIVMSMSSSTANPYRS